MCVGGKGWGGLALFFVTRLIPLIIVKYPSSGFLEHLLIVHIIHLTFTRSGLVDLINFYYSWITYTEAAGQVLCLFLIISIMILAIQLGSGNKWWFWQFRQK